jgi:hypothetical protein
VDYVAHEFRTPLTVIKEYATIIRDGLVGQVNAQQRRYLDVVSDRADDLAIMVDDLSDATKLEAGRLSLWRRRSSVAELLGPVRPILERKAAITKVHLEISLADELPDVYCDPEKIGRVIVHLVTGALRCCDEGGRVTLRVRSNAALSEVVVAVSHDGTPVECEAPEPVFGRLHPIGGSAGQSVQRVGLGLWIARELVHRNLGQIAASDSPNGGHAISFSLPEWDPAGLLERYLGSCRQCGDGSASVALAVAELAPPVEPGFCGLVDEFLQHFFRGDELAVQVLAHRWLLVARCHEGQVAEMAGRLRRQWAEASRDGPLGQLPEIAVRPKGVWRLESQADELIRQYRAELPSSALPSETARVAAGD